MAYAAIALLGASLGLFACGGDRTAAPSAAAERGAIPSASAEAAATPTATTTPSPTPQQPRTSSASPITATRTTAAAGKPPLVVFLGDSLTAGLGLSVEEAWPTLLAARLAADGTPIRAVNAGVSGDTSAGGLRRLSWVLRQRPDVVVVELGANDGMRGQPVPGVEANLRQIVERSRAAGARVLLLGLRVPPSLGGDYSRQFGEVYPRLARELDTPFVPFLLEGVAGDPDLNLPDGIHPNAEGQRRVAEVVRPYLEDVLREQSPAPAAR